MSSKINWGDMTVHSCSRRDHELLAMFSSFVLKYMSELQAVWHPGQAHKQLMQLLSRESNEFQAYESV
jgi:hypothetical protein